MKKTKRLLSLILCTVFLVACCAVGASAASPDDGREIISQTIEYLEDGSSIVTVVSMDPVQAYSTTVSGSKSSTWRNSSGEDIWAVVVYGTFEYQYGSYSYASSAADEVLLYSSRCSLQSRNSYCSNNRAVATASVNYNSVPSSMTVSLACDTNGRLS